MTLVKENDIVKIPYRHPNHKNRNSKKWEMLKDNNTNMIKAPNDGTIGNPNSQQQNDGSKRTHKSKIAKGNKTLSNNSKEIFRFRNHNSTLVTKIKKLKNSQKTEQSTEDIEGKLLDKQEENSCIRSHNKDIKEQLKNSEDDRKCNVPDPPTGQEDATKHQII